MKFGTLIQLGMFSVVFGVSVVVGFVLLRDYQDQTRGVSPELIAPLPFPYGVNASLEQSSNDADLSRALEMIRGAGFYWVRQYFTWNEIEPRPNEYQWDRWDRIVARSSEFGLHLVAVITTTPEWARDGGERDLLYAKPAREEDYARFVAAFVRRYGDKIQFVQIWDNPNVHPFWGRRNADPFEYTALLRAAAISARTVSIPVGGEGRGGVKIISAGLAPSAELIRGHADFSDVLYLRGMYDAGARPYFDILGAKPFGMWSGPDDRRAAMDVFNFSRAILLREEMVAHSDAGKPVWAVELGWNALPNDWRGAASPWGTDSEEKQSARLTQAIQRARSEWGWMPALFVQHFQPNAPETDPIWGFALVDRNFQPRPAYSAVKSAIATPIQPASSDSARFYLTLVVLAVVGVVAAWRGAIAFNQLRCREAWPAVHARFNAIPELAQLLILVTVSAAFYFSPNIILNFALLALLVLLFSFRLDLGLLLTVFAIPFYLLPKNLVSGAQFSMVEVLTLVNVAAWVIRAAGLTPQVSDHKAQAASILKPASWGLKLETADWAILALVLIAALSVKLAANFGVANREFRVNILEPALVYALIRASNLQRRDLMRLVHSFILSAVAVSLIGIYQLLFTNYVIIGEGVRRVLGVYNSPNNLALYLDRALPLVVALASIGGRRRLEVAATPTQSRPEPALRNEGSADSAKRDTVLSLPRIHLPLLLYALAAISITLALYFTYSRGAWLIGVPAGLLVLGWLGGKRARLAIIALIVVGAIVLIPFLQTERAQSLFQTGTGTGFFRTSVWRSAIAMIRDHPVFGVGLDNFLYEYPKYMNPDAWREPNLSHPHNIVLDFWARLGVLGVGVLVWMIIEFYRKGMRELGEGRTVVIGLVASMTAALAHGMIDAAFFYVDLAFVWMLMLGLMVEWSDSHRGE